MNKEQISSYGASLTTGGGSLLVQVNQWTAMDWLTAMGIFAGIAGCLVRAYIDIAAHLDRKRGKNQ